MKWGNTPQQTNNQEEINKSHDSKTTPKKLNHYIIDCRPDGYKGNRVRLIVEGKDQAKEAHDILMRKDQEFTLTPAVMSVSSIYRQWIVYYRNNRQNELPMMRRTAGKIWGHTLVKYHHEL